MKKKTLDFGGYYRSSKNNTLVKVVARANNQEDKSPMIIYSYINEGGIASGLHYMNEDEFINIYLEQFN